MSKIHEDILRLDEIIDAIGTEQTGNKTPRQLRDEAQPLLKAVERHLEESNYAARYNTLTKLCETQGHIDEAVGISHGMKKDPELHRCRAMGAFYYVKAGIPGTPEHIEEND